MCLRGTPVIQREECSSTPVGSENTHLLFSDDARFGELNWGHVVFQKNDDSRIGNLLVLYSRVIPEFRSGASPRWPVISNPNSAREQGCEDNEIKRFMT